MLNVSIVVAELETFVPEITFTLVPVVAEGLSANKILYMCILRLVCRPAALTTTLLPLMAAVKVQRVSVEAAPVLPELCSCGCWYVYPIGTDVCAGA